MDGLILDGTPLPRPDGDEAGEPFGYHGFYRHGKRVVFAYRIGEIEMLDAPWVEDGKFTRDRRPGRGAPARRLDPRRPGRNGRRCSRRDGTLGRTRPYAVDTIEPPFENPWNALLFFGDHDFLPDGTAMLCTMQGDVWRVGAGRRPDPCAGGGSPRGCIRRSGWWSPTAASTSWAATRSPACTTSTATARPTSTNA